MNRAALLALVVAVAACGCANGSSSSKEPKMPVSAAGTLIRTAEVALDAEVWKPCELDGAGRRIACQRFTTSGGAAVVAELQASPITTVAVDALVAEGAPLLVTETDFRELGSDRRVALTLGRDEAWWAAPTSGASYVRIAQRRGGPDTAVELYDAAAGTQRWRVGLDRLNGYPTGVGVAPDGSLVVVFLRALDESDTRTLVGFDGADGTERWRRPIADRGLRSPSPILFHPDGKELVVLLAKTGAAEPTGQLVAFGAADGAELRRVALPASGLAFQGKLGDDMSAGYDGAVVWFHQLQPSRPISDTPGMFGGAGREPGDTIDASCHYEVYDAAHAQPRAVRTDADATGRFAELWRGCHVLAMRALAGRSVAVITVGPRQLTVSVFDGPP